ncbi:MAG TPA: hypothetical protein DCY13_13470 [Verrucomicrobiales bacterium]|nr:hypothetical protein [Verrucomicrobiales bacterium]
MHSLEFGHVKAHDEDGWPLGGVSVTLALPGKPLRTATTDQQGKVLLTGFPASEGTEWANGKVSASLAGFASETRDVKDGWPMSFRLKREPSSSSPGQAQN